jgi:metal-sulfur cluster biosynthetic enzyme
MSSLKPSLSPDQVTSALYALLDPEFSLSVVDLGLIYDVQVSEESIAITMTLTSPTCPAGQVICEGVQSTLEPLANGRTIDVKLTWDPAWTPEMISPAGREQLGWVESN